MASEASGSSNAAADSYIGSFISLISKSENRYEGILHDLNIEESNIGLTNVQSFGTEGRKKDGPQVPPSDKVYEYILFRGKDIKDLQVKACPPVQGPQPIHIDPAIIQYSRTPSMPTTSLPSAGSGPVKDPSSHAAQRAIPRSTLHDGSTLYQPGGSSGSLGSTTPLNADDSDLSMPMPMPWQGFYPPLNSHAQQPFFQPTPRLSMPHSMLQPFYPGTSSPLPTGSSNMIVSSVTDSNLLGYNMPASSLPASNLREFTPLLPPFSIGTANLTSTTPRSTLPPQSVILVSESLPSLMPNMVSSAAPATTLLSDTLPLVSQSTTSKLDMNPITVPGTMPKMALSSSLSSDPAKKDTKVVRATSSKPPASGPVTTQAPILPLPPAANHKLNGPPVQTLHKQTNRGHERGRVNGRSFIPSGNDGHECGRGIDRGCERGRGNGISRHVTNFTEEFDFIAMNEKFKKDEIWGDLGKANKTKRRDVFELDDDVESLKLEKPVYVKDDFFDSISCNSHEYGQRNGRNFSEQRKVNGETFGDFPRHRGGRGGLWPDRGGRSRGSYYGTGYGYVGRGGGTN